MSGGVDAGLMMWDESIGDRMVRLGWVVELDFFLAKSYTYSATKVPSILLY